jgi:hypothetical protein
MIHAALLWGVNADAQTRVTYAVAVNASVSFEPTAHVVFKKKQGQGKTF